MPQYYLWDHEYGKWNRVHRPSYDRVMQKAQDRGVSARGFIKDDDNELGVQEPVQETPKRKFTCRVSLSKLYGGVSWLEVEDSKLGVIVFSTSFIYGNEQSFKDARRRVDEWCERHGGRIV